MSRNPTQQDVAEAAGVSRGLVSLALSGSPTVARATRERILAAARELGYTRNLGAASLAARRSPVVGVVLPDLRNPFFESVVARLQEQADAQRLLPLVATSADDPRREATVLQRFRELRVAGIIMVSPVQGPVELEATGAQIPLVLIGVAIPGRNFDTVHVDEHEAARLVVTHLRERGWRSIVAIAFDAGPGDVWVDHRQSALAEAAADQHVQFTRAEVEQGTGVSPVLSPLLGGARGDRLAVVAHNDLVAADALAFARSSGLAPGRDLAVLGYDDTYIARRPEFDITSVSQDTGDLARLAMSSLAERGGRFVASEQASEMLGQREFIVPPTLAVRRTT